MTDKTAEQERASIVAFVRSIMRDLHNQPLTRKTQAHINHCSWTASAIERGDHHKIIDAVQNNA